MAGVPLPADLFLVKTNEQLDDFCDVTVAWGEEFMCKQKTFETEEG